MDQPLTDYYINSSHNTYLASNQLTGKSDINCYINALKEGVRCVEIDCWVTHISYTNIAAPLIRPRRGAGAESNQDQLRFRTSSIGGDASGAAGRGSPRTIFLYWLKRSVQPLDMRQANSQKLRYSLPLIYLFFFFGRFFKSDYL